MQKSIITLVVLFFITVISAQHVHQAPCGAPSYRSEWLKKYQLHPEAYAVSRDETMYVPIAVNIVTEDNGIGGLSDIGIQNALCVLNQDFEQMNIIFYLGRDIRTIKDSRYAQHEKIEQGYAMMQQYDEPDMINCYFMADAAGNCGYNLPSAGMCVSNNCAGPNDHTWAHEMGHQLSLPHPFLGWEGGVSHDGSIQHDYNNPAPEIVLYNYTGFKEIFYTDTIIIDTAYVEKMDGSNCEYAADGFCDTKPDYLSSRWVCDSDSISNTLQTDPNGEVFYSDGKLIMSYALDNCSATFSEEQIAASRAFLLAKKPHVLGMHDPQDPVTVTELTGQSLVDLEQVFPENIEITWDPVPGATKYLIQLSIFESFGIPVYDAIVSEPAVLIESLQFPNRDHFYRIKAFNDYNFCSDWLEGIGSFTPNESVSTSFENNIKWSIYPNTISCSDILYIDGITSHSEPTIALYNANGQLILRELIRNNTVSVNNLSKGLYMANISDGNKTFMQKLIVQ